MEEVTLEEYATHSNDVAALGRQIPDDSVEYTIYSIDAAITTESDLRKRLKQIETEAKRLVKTHLEGYIWQRDDFRLSLSRPPSTAGPKSKQIKDRPLPLCLTSSLHGVTSFGDSIADEWAIVYLLRELSKTCKDVWIRITDSDGEFLLVEAALRLPKWLEPGIADHRVWIHAGELRIVAENESPSQSISLQQAVETIQSQPLKLLRDPGIERAAFSRLKDYPAAIAETFHHAIITIPRRLAYVLHERPGCISAAVESFYLRNPIALRTLATKDTGTLYVPPEDFVSVSVKFTRVGYAQLMSQEFPLPGSWSGISPHINEPRVLMGMKVACGFEMLLQSKQNVDRQVVREIKLLLGDVESGEDCLPSDKDIQSWDQQQDLDSWLDIKFDDLDGELNARTGATAGSDPRSNLHDDSVEKKLENMVSGFESFVGEGKAGLNGVDELSDDDEDDDGDDAESDSSSELDSEGEDKAGSFDEAEFERAMRQVMGLPGDEKEKNGLMDEARKLALEMEEDEEIYEDEDEIRQMMEDLGKELKGLGALNLNQHSEARAKGKSTANRKGKAAAQDAAESSDDEDLLADESDWTKSLGKEDSEKTIMVKNLLESLKHQGGSSGPTSNMLAAMGIRIPRNDDDDDDDDDDDNLI